MIERQQVLDAIRSCWAADTSGTPEEWSPQNPAKGQCDVSSFIAWEYLGGDLVLSRVFIDGEQTEHHYSNRLEGEDIDVTAGQFSGDEEIKEVSVVADDYLRKNRGTMRPELAARIVVMRSAVRDLIGDPVR